MKFFALGLIFIFIGAVWAALPLLTNSPIELRLPAPGVSFTSPQPKTSALPKTAPKALPSTYIIPLQKHVFQTFNNCGPASLSMALSYLGFDVSQAEIGQALRPYQIPKGDNDDKSVTFPEIAEYAKKYNLVAFHRPNGSIDMLKKFISNDI